MSLYISSKSNEDQKNELQEAFAVFDRNGDGTISAKELTFIMANLGEKLDEDEIKHMMKIVDVDGDGEISYEEFAGMMTKVLKRA